MKARVLFPRAGFTTEDLAAAYEQLAPALLPHLADRPLTLKRFPDDIYGEAFWEKDAPAFTPRWVRRLPVPRKHEPGLIHYIAIPDVKTLRWVASMGCIEIHAFLHKYPYITSPTAIAFDLDPGPGADLLVCCEVALLVRQWLKQRGLECFAKTSGSKGMQIYVPLNTPSSYGVTGAFARHLAEDLEREHPGQIISRMERSARAHKVFIDWSQNMEHKTTVAPYSIRAKRNHPYVSMPVGWDEVKAALKKRDADALAFSPDAAAARVKETGDLFSPVLTMEQEIPRKVLDALGIRPLMKEPEPVHVPAEKPAAKVLPRSSGQGGRKLFVIHRSGERMELAIEVEDVFQPFSLEALPARRRQSSPATHQQPRTLDYLTQESEQSGIVWDLGTYELVEGSYAKGHLLIYLSGRRVTGEWSLEKASAASRDPKWKVANKGGRVTSESNTSVLDELTLPWQMRARHAG